MSSPRTSQAPQGAETAPSTAFRQTESPRPAADSSSARWTSTRAAIRSASSVNRGCHSWIRPLPAPGVDAVVRRRLHRSAAKPTSTRLPTATSLRRLRHGRAGVHASISLSIRTAPGQPMPISGSAKRFIRRASTTKPPKTFLNAHQEVRHARKRRRNTEARHVAGRARQHGNRLRHAAGSLRSATRSASLAVITKVASEQKRLAC